MFIKTLAVSGLLAAATAPCHAASTPCVTTPSANVSHFPTHNNQYGGHINKHIAGQTPPHGYSQYGATMFRDVHDYDDAWNDLSGQQAQLQCADSPPRDATAARDVDLQLFSEQCTAADHAGVCTHHTSVQTNRVTFVFRALPNGAGARWVLYTSYPHN